ncbi:hypothetical protein DL96DRAFT_1591160 [Flagelloscypha sp. PMI_526]|nr:hypothetical protein DL96DRAFT_1591160 [Flagelloscypha sp. PMI_526]
MNTHPSMTCTSFRHIQSLADCTVGANYFKASPELPPSPAVPPPLTPAGISRVAANAIRVSLKNDGFSDAIHIHNSVRISKYARPQKDGTHLFNLPMFIEDLPSPSSFAPIAVEFPGPVNPRLPTASFIHGLIRLGEKERAARAALAFIREGHRLPKRTFDAVLRTHLPTNRVYFDRILPRWRHTLKDVPVNRDALDVFAQPSGNPSVQLAFALIQAARKTRTKRTTSTMNLLITLALINGEIGVAALIWGTLPEIMTSSSIAPPKKSPTFSLHGRKPSAYLEPEEDENWFEKVSSKAPEPDIPPNTDLEDDQVLRPPKDPTRAAFQALAHLANILHARLMPITSFAPLLRTMSRVPHSTIRVWIEDPWTHSPRRVNAFNYIHFVLSDLAWNLPNGSDFDNSLTPQMRSYLPALHVGAYNALLHYAAHSRRDPAMVDNILRHMVYIKKCPPTISTYNTLLRCCTLMGSDEDVLLLMDLILQHSSPSTEEGHHQVNDTLRAVIVARQRARASTADSTQLHLIETLRHLPPNLSKPFEPDMYTITSILHHFLEVGHPQIVVLILDILLPGLGLVEHIDEDQSSLAEDRFSPEELEVIRANLRSGKAYTLLPRVPAQMDEARRRGALLGPRFFVTCLHVLRRAGMLGSAERLFLLSKHAQSTSWDPKSGARGGWCLPIEAYTIMLEAYGMRVDSHSGWNGKAMTGKSKEILKSRGLSFLPYTSEPIKMGRTVQLKLSNALYQKMFKTATELYTLIVDRVGSTLEPDGVMDLRTFPFNSPMHKEAQLPQPDAHFFNVALSTFLSFESGSSWRRIPDPEARRLMSIRNLKQAQQAWLRYGVTPDAWSPQLHRVKEDMERAGFSVPVGLRWLFAGRDAKFVEESLVDPRTRRLVLGRVERLETASEYLVPSRPRRFHRRNGGGVTRRNNKAQSERTALCGDVKKPVPEVAAPFPESVEVRKPSRLPWAKRGQVVL